ncbi:uncharacterized protein [Amphiura filiformis]|uniref:uncharacterized protein n=1 Tax=Amphiura filiformis TaxID=82378 RepID=UPI003B2271C1
MWSTGDKCMAPFSEDDQYYRATIVSIATDCQGNRRATVKFSGYTSEDNETVDLVRIKERTVRRQHRSGTGKSTTGTRTSASSCSSDNTSFTSPLRYMPEQDRLREKFSDLLDNEPPAISVTLTSPQSSCGSRSTGKTTQKRKYAVAVGGEIKETSQAHTPSNSTSRLTSNQHIYSASSSTRAPCSISPDRNEGFSSMELERPYFPHSSNVGPKVPLLLSEPDKEPVVQIPATINRYLRDYQREGVKFLYQHFVKNEGAILGDDMGLGKTVQVIAFLCAVLGKTGTKEDCQRRLPEFLQKQLKCSKTQSTDVYLIICPNAVLYNWLDEFETWTYCTAGKYHGKERGETLLKAMRGKLDVVLTTYETYRIYLDEIHRVPWSAVFVDEVHKIKAPSSQITEALKKVNTLRRYGLSGTALQNQMTELWCILDWAKPDCLGPLYDFKHEFENVINRGQRFDANKRELAEGRQTSLRFSRLRDNWMLRRTKALIAHQLPTKEEKVVFCKLTDLQLSVYKALLDSYDLQTLVLRQNELCDCGSQVKRRGCCYQRNDQGIKVKALTFSFMTLLTKVSNHVALLMPETKMSDLQRLTVQTYCDIAFAKHPQFVRLSRESRFCTLSDPKYCGKMQVLQRLLQVFKRENSKVLIFSHYTQLLDIFEMYLKTTDYVYRRLDGKTPAQDRLKYVHEFNRDKDIFLFLISTKAGGIGLNLTGANVVIIYDPNWNPTYDLQAQDRAYRIGQHRDVRVYRLISAGSIEENMYLRQIYKQQIASVAIESENAKRYFTGVAGNNSGELFGLTNMFELRTGDCILTKDVIERESKTIKGITMAKYIPLPAAAPANASDENNQQKPASSTNDDDEDEDEMNPASVESEDEDDKEDSHGIASQLMISDESDTDEPITKQGQCKQGEEASGKTSTCEEDARTDQNQKKCCGKAILRKDGRVERRIKGREQDVNGDGRTDLEEERGSESDKRRIVQGGQEQKLDTVDDVLKECGISYVHSNNRLVGGSKIEDHVSNAAIHDVFEMDQHSQEPANYNVPSLEQSLDSQSSANAKDQVNKSASSLYHSHNVPSCQSKPLSDKVNSTTILIGQTPKGIRRRHFEDLAKTKGLSTVELANQILSASLLEGQVQLLKDYYTNKHHGHDLEKYFELKDDEPEPAAKIPKSRTKTLKQSQLKGSRRVTGGKQSTQTQRRVRTTQQRKRPKPKGFHFESGSESDDSDSDDYVAEIKCKRTSRNSEVVKEINKNRTNTGPSPLSSGAEEMDTSDSMDALDAKVTHDASGTHDSLATHNALDNPGSDMPENPDQEEFTTLRGQGRNGTRHDRHETESLSRAVDKTKKDKCNEKSSAVENTSAQDQNLSFLDDIFLTSPSVSKMRKPPPKKKSPRRKDLVVGDEDSLQEDKQLVSISELETFSDKKNCKPPPKKRSLRRKDLASDVDSLWDDKRLISISELDSEETFSDETIRKPPPKKKQSSHHRGTLFKTKKQILQKFGRCECIGCRIGKSPLETKFQIWTKDGGGNGWGF